jgi:hypothetical protein
MPERTLAIIFRNPNPQRSPIRTKLYLLRRDGSSVLVDDPHYENSIHANAAVTSSEAGERLL